MSDQTRTQISKVLLQRLQGLTQSLEAKFNFAIQKVTLVQGPWRLVESLVHLKRIDSA